MSDEDVPRLKSKLWVSGHLRRCEGAGAYSVIVRRGDPDAGAIAIKIYDSSRQARLIQQSVDLSGNTVWRDVFGGLRPEKDIDERLEKEIRMDPDLWILEIEHCDGYGFLEVQPSEARISG